MKMFLLRDDHDNYNCINYDSNNNKGNNDGNNSNSNNNYFHKVNNQN